MINRTLIRRRTQEKELRLSGELVMTKEEWVERGGTYRGTLGQAAQLGFYTIRACEKLGQPVTETEKVNCKDFAMYSNCYMEYCIGHKRPCLPVFFREKEATVITVATNENNNE